MTTKTLDRMPTTISELLRYVDDQPVDGESFKIAPNTTATWHVDLPAIYDVSPWFARNGHHGGFAVKLHGHTIALVHQNGDVSVRHCGWVTTTTMDRLNRFTRPIGWSCFRKSGQALVRGIRSGELDTIEARLWTRLEA